MPRRKGQKRKTKAVIDEEDDEMETRSPLENPRPSDRDFIVDDTNDYDRDDTYTQTEGSEGEFVATEDEDKNEDEAWEGLLHSGTLTPKQERMVLARISTIRENKIRRSLWTNDQHRPEGWKHNRDAAEGHEDDEEGAKRITNIFTTFDEIRACFSQLCEKAKHVTGTHNELDSVQFRVGIVDDCLSVLKPDYAK